MPENLQGQYDDFNHTARISLRTFIKIFDPVNNADGFKILSEGAYRIEFLYTGVEGDLRMKFNGGDEVSLFGTGLDDNVIDPRLIWVLPGNPNTVRDDIIDVLWESGTSPDSRLIVIFHRVVPKKDDNYYIAQAGDTKTLAVLNNEGLE